MKINVHVIWDCRVLMACNGKTDTICTSIVIYDKLSHVNAAVQMLAFVMKYPIMWKTFGNEPIGW